MVKFIQKNYLIILILFLGIVLRFYRLPEYLEYLGDQGRDLVVIRNFLKNGNLFFIGPQTSIGNMYLGPYFYYFIAPSLWVANYSPIGPAAFVALIGIATIFLIYFISLRWFDRKTAVISSLLYAISPVVIRYSTFSWNPNVAPFFSLLFSYFIFEGLSKQKYRFLIFASLSFIMALNTHYLCLLILLPAGIFWLIHLYQHRLAVSSSFIKQTLLAILVFLISLTPQVLFDIRHHGQNTKALIAFFTERETTVNLKAYKALPEIVPLFNQINTRLLFGKNETYGPYLSILLFLSIIFLFIRLSKEKRLPFLFIFSWLFFGLIGLGLYKQHIYDHYFGFIFPALFIIAGLSISNAWKSGLILKITSSVLLISMVSLSVIANPFRYSPNSQLQTDQAIVDSIITKSKQKPFNLALLAKQNYDPPYRYLFSLTNSLLYTIEEKHADQLFVICEPWQITCEPINNPQTEIANYGWAKITDKWEINNIQIFHLIPYEK
jgi:4-amino-4-deoxy-L-arabinose transferase-like glycosyltransferase